MKSREESLTLTKSNIGVWECALPMYLFYGSVLL